MVGVAQLVEHQVVVLRVVGSIPITHPICFWFETPLIHDVLEGDCAFVAQLDRVTDFGSVGYRFEPYRAHHIYSCVLSSAG